MLLDSDGSVSERWGLIGLPMNVLVDAKGMVAMVKFGTVDGEMMKALGSKREGIDAALPDSGK